MTLGLAVTVSIGVSSQADPFVGTWTLDVAKSKYDPGPPPKSQTLRIEAAGHGATKLTNEAVSATGTKTVSVYTSAPDGKEVPIVGSPSADTVSTKRIDANTVTRTDRKGGNVVATYTVVVSTDGKTLTSIGTGTNPAGQAMNNTMVFVKQ